VLEEEHADREAEGGSSTASGETGARAVPVAALRAADILAWMVNLLAAKAWEGMGLVPNPLTNKVEKDLVEARLAIDAYAAIFEVIRVRIDEQPRREMESVLTMLRLNFVEKSGSP